MKLWRKMGNKVTVKNDKGEDVVLTGRQFKRMNFHELPKQASSLLAGMLLYAAVPNWIINYQLKGKQSE